MDNSDGIKKLDELRESGILSPEEYRAARRRLAGSPSARPGHGSTVTISIVVGVLTLLVVLGVGLASVGVLAAVAIPNFVAMQYRAKRIELPENVNAIKLAELTHESAFDGLVEIRDPVPRPTAALDSQRTPWPEGSAFDALDWAPSDPVRGTYWVELSADGRDFTVHGVMDVDGDGQNAHYTATKSIDAVMLTPEDRF